MLLWAGILVGCASTPARVDHLADSAPWPIAINTTECESQGQYDNDVAVISGAQFFLNCWGQHAQTLDELRESVQQKGRRLETYTPIQAVQFDCTLRLLPSQLCI